MSSVSYNIRPIRQEDRAEFLALSREFYASPAVLHPIADSYHKDAFTELMRSDAYLAAYLICEGERIAGYALLNKTYCREAGGPTVWIEELYLRPSDQGKGAGRAFFRWLEENIPAARYRLEVEPDNQRAAALYRRMGYEALPYLQMIRDNSAAGKQKP